MSCAQVSSELTTIRSFPIEGKHFLYYFPRLNLLTLDGETPGSYLSYDESFGDTLLRYFQGIRKLVALKQAHEAPAVLFVEPWRICNLACTYCYAQSGPDQRKRIDAGWLAALLNRYAFKRALVFGGEPLMDGQDGQFLLKLYRSQQWESFFFSTNGVLLRRESSQELVASPNVHFQVSLEPREWNTRVTVDGKRQLDQLPPRLGLLRNCRPSLRITIPADAPYVPLKGLIDGFAELLGGLEFTMSYWPAHAPVPAPWVESWIQESYELLRSDEDGRYKGRLPGSDLMIYFRESAQKGFRFFNCNASHGSVAAGPDNKLHGCHELAIVESELDVISSPDQPLEIDKEKRLNLVYKWSGGMTNPGCAKCPARYLCGGVCFVLEAPNAACLFLRGMLQVVLTEMVRYDPGEIMGLASRSEETLKQLFSMREELQKEVNSERWMRLVFGELPLAEAMELAGRLLGN